MKSTQDSTTNYHYQETKMDKDMEDIKEEVKVTKKILVPSLMQIKDHSQEDMNPDLKEEEKTSETLRLDNQETAISVKDHSTQPEDMPNSMMLLPLLQMREEISNHSDQDHWEQ